LAYIGQAFNVPAISLLLQWQFKLQGLFPPLLSFAVNLCFLAANYSDDLPWHSLQQDAGGVTPRFCPRDDANRKKISSLCADSSGIKELFETTDITGTQ
jgi:hypothetical protein